MKVRFLLDENLSPFGFGSSDSTETAKTPTSSPRLKVAVLRLNPAIDILRVGESNAPILGTLDQFYVRLRFIHVGAIHELPLQRGFG